MREEALIRALIERFPAAPGQSNRPFTSDAEILAIGGTNFALTLDEFSAEDGFDASAPWPLGWNVVIATLSDLLAVGAVPRLFLNALVVAPSVDEAWVAAFAAGMREALAVSGASLVGGDVGTADAWRVTGFALGTIPEGRAPLSRVPAVERGVVLATGTFGDGNLAAAVGATPLFECRAEEAEALASSAAAAIDTSDGLASALATFARLSPDLRIEIDLDAVRLTGGVAEAASDLGVPPEAFLVGGAGEYELLALAPEGPVPLADSLRRIGTFERATDAGVFFRRGDGSIVEMPALPDPRTADSRESYREGVVAVARALAGEGGRP